MDLWGAMLTTHERTVISGTLGDAGEWRDGGQTCAIGEGRDRGSAYDWMSVTAEDNGRVVTLLIVMQGGQQCARRQALFK